uniref:Uncharacterized protein n=2 Tax=Meloidogyne TaxID=189290 RepID=A0A6V7VHB4_MELEN|nr:unnamed protein product [Meloidogyne enterolobii]
MEHCCDRLPTEIYCDAVVNSFVHIHNLSLPPTDMLPLSTIGTIISIICTSIMGFRSGIEVYEWFRRRGAETSNSRTRGGGGGD